MACALGFGAMLATVVASAAADERELPLSLTWKDDADCAPTARVLEAVTHLLGDEAQPVPHVVASVTSQRTTDGVKVTLETEQLGERGLREFDATTCDKAADAVALVLSVMLAPADTTETVTSKGFRTAPPPPAPPPPEPAAAPKAAPAPQPDAPAPEPESHGVHFHIGPRFGGDVGVLSQATLFVGGEVGLRWSWLRVALGAAWWVPRPTDEGPRPGTGGTVGLVAGAARGCVIFLDSPVQLDACAALEVGRAHGEGEGLRNPRETDALWLAAVPGLALRAPTPILPTIVAVDVPIGIVRPEFTIDEFGPVYQASPVAIRATLGADLVFP